MPRRRSTGRAHPRNAMVVTILGASVVLAACGRGGPPPEAAEQPARETSAGAEAALDVRALLDPGVRLRMPVDGIPCEGPGDALITVVEYVAYECPFTRRLEPTLRRLLEEHAGEVRFCVRQLVNVPDQPNGMLAAHVALETFTQRGAATFFRLHRALLDAELDDAAVIVWAAMALGVDGAELRAALESTRHNAALIRDRDDVLRVSYGDTPQLFVSGRVVAGDEPYEVIAPVFASAIAEARRLVDAGVHASELYAVVQQDAVSEVEWPEPRPREPERVRVRFIDIATSRSPLARGARRSEAEARAIAERLVAELRAGADFGELARRWSAAPNRERGGDFGWISRRALAEPVEDLVIALGVGEIGFVCTLFGCLVIERLE